MKITGRSLKDRIFDRLLELGLIVIAAGAVSVAINVGGLRAETVARAMSNR